MYIKQTDQFNFKPCMKKPIVVHAYQLPEDSEVETLEGVMAGKKGDYLMKGIDGEYYICDRSIFERTYDFVEKKPLAAKYASETRSLMDKMHGQCGLCGSFACDGNCFK